MLSAAVRASALSTTSRSFATAGLVSLLALSASCASARARVMTDKNRPAPAVNAAPDAVRAISVGVSQAADCEDGCTTDGAVCPPKKATETFMADVRAALAKAGFRVIEQGAGDLSLEVCVRATSGDEKTSLWEGTGQDAREYWDPANGEFGKDPNGFLFEASTTMCPTAGRKIVIGQQKSAGYDSGAAAAEIANRLSGCEALRAAAEKKAGIAPAPAATLSAAPPASSPAAPAATAASAPKEEPGDEDIIELTDGTKIRGLITKEEPGKVVIVERADGRSESIAWAGVVKIVHRTEEDVVRLKNGSFVRGTVQKEEPGKAVVIKRSDGRTDTIPWDEVLRVVRGKKK